MNRQIANARRRRKLGEHAQCDRCGFDGLAALEQTRAGVHCYECGRARAGTPTVEWQHPLGRKVDPRTVGMPGNLHRMVDDMKYDWPNNVRTNTQGDPLLWLAAVAYSARDMAQVVAQCAGRVGAWLVRCAEMLRERFGERWWEELGLPSLWGAPSP